MIYFITNRKLININNYINHIGEISKKVEYVIFREKDIEIEKARELINKITQIVDKKKLIINSFFQIANEIDCHGVHFTYRDYFEHNMKVNNGIKIGVSVHNENEIRVLNEKENIDYIIYGHIFNTNCKKDLESKGLEDLKKVVKLSKKEIIPVGGITPENKIEIEKLGINKVAIMSYYY